MLANSDFATICLFVLVGRNQSREQKQNIPEQHRTATPLALLERFGNTPSGCSSITERCSAEIIANDCRAVTC